MGCEPGELCAEPAKARKYEPSIIKARTPADQERERQQQTDQARRGVEPVGPQSEEAREARNDLVNQYAWAADYGFDALNRALGHAAKKIDSAEKPRNSRWVEYLGIAVGALLAGSSGAIALWAARIIEDRIANKLVADAVKDTISKSLKGAGSSPSPVASDDVKDAFGETCEQEIDRTKARFISEWPSTAARLRVLPAASLRELTQAELAQAPRETLIASVEHQILIGWTNFLARLAHGGMSGWDPWQRHGREGNTRSGYATPLRGAARNPYEVPEAERVDPTLNNVEPKNMLWAVDEDQRTHEGEHVGILEVHLWADGRLNLEPGYGMRLDNVGPRVRQAFKASKKTVRDLPVNKIVRVSNRHGQIEPPMTNGAFLITSDGYVRLTAWALPMDMSTFAERAQDLPLSWLKD